MPQAKSPMKLVLIEWEDAYCMDDGETWVSKADAENKTEPMIFMQVGWLLSLNKDHAILCHAIDKEETTHSVRDYIPAGMIRQILVFPPDAGLPMSIPKRRRKSTNG